MGTEKHVLTRSTFERLPPHLRAYVVKQDYQKYTARDQAVWRFIMRNSRSFFQKNAYPVYLDGLKKTGIPIDRIPQIEQMDAVLSEFGWGAVCVCGFIPPLAFLDFGAHKILPIAADMRSFEHMTYTPAPDIVHEAAGHAPILADPHYREYLARYAQVARKAIFSKEDVALYEAIRALSDIKENPDATAADIASAEKGLDQATKAIQWVSEAARVARLFWWTAEYGLVGSMERPFIYGAGLLSSLGEGQSCFDAKVKKVPLTIDCTKVSYDITEPQPQLFVTPDFAHLLTVLHELESVLAFKTGGAYGLDCAVKAQAITTVVLDSGLEISGVLSQRDGGSADVPAYLRWAGRVQLCYAGKEIAGHGTERHGSGFGLPLGPWAEFPGRDPKRLTDAELKQGGLQVGKPGTLHFNSGVALVGTLKSTVRKYGVLLLLTFENCTVKAGDQLYFDPAWGEFDLGIGSAVPSVFGGPSDWAAYGEFSVGKASTQPGRLSSFTPEERELFAHYQELRAMREGTVYAPRLAELSKAILQKHPKEWLLALEVLELAEGNLGLKTNDAPWAGELRAKILNPKNYPAEVARFVELGLGLVAVP